MDRASALHMLTAIPPRPEGHRPYIWVALAAVLGIVLGLLLVPAEPEVRGGARLPLRLLGRELPRAPDAPELAASWIQQRLDGSFTLELPDAEPSRVTYA